MSKKRSRSYPALNLKDVYDIFLKKFKNWKKVSGTREEIGNRLGYSTGTGGNAVRKISALVQYGFLDRENRNYRVSKLGTDLMGEPSDVNDLLHLLQTALRRPHVFREILEEYGHHSRLPPDLPDVFVNHGITSAASVEVAKIFKESAVFAKVVGPDGYFIVPDLDEADLDVSEFLDDEIDKEIIGDSGEADQNGNTLLSFVDEFDILLKHGRRVSVSFRVPSNFSEGDVDDSVDQVSSRLRHLAGYLKTQPVRTDTVKRGIFGERRGSKDRLSGNLG